MTATHATHAKPPPTRPAPIGPQTYSDAARISAALIPTDAAASRSERTWGVGRLLTLVSSASLLAWRTGWQRYSDAITQGDAAAVERIAPKIIQALAALEAEATAAGYQPISPRILEARMSDGRVLVIVATHTEATAVARAARSTQDGAQDAEAAQLPPDARNAVSAQQAGRELVVWALPEIVHVIEQYDAANLIKRTWPGARVTKATHRAESFASDWATNDPLLPALHGVEQEAVT